MHKSGKTPDEKLLFMTAVKGGAIRWAMFWIVQVDTESKPLQCLAFNKRIHARTSSSVTGVIKKMHVKKVALI